jgi:hypothetical protein
MTIFVLFFYLQVTKSCKPFQCLRECKAAVLAARAREPCMSHPIWWDWAQSSMGKTDNAHAFLFTVNSCNAEIAVDEARAQWEKESTQPPVDVCLILILSS